MEILITNDDSYMSRGLASLMGIMKPFGNITVLAPKIQQSATGCSVTMGHRPIVFRELGEKDGVRWMYLDGTPASCVKFAIDNVFTDRKPDIVVSGINHGSNAGAAACYSGTLGAAMEAAINRIPAVGVSLDDLRSDADFSVVERCFPDIFKNLLGSLQARYGIFYNVNFPNLPYEKIKGVRVAHQGIGHWVEEFEDWDPDFFESHGIDPALYGIASVKVISEEGEKTYVMRGHFEDYEDNEPGADHRLLAEGYITITAHNADSTDRAEVARLRALGLDSDWK